MQKTTRQWLRDNSPEMCSNLERCWGYAFNEWIPAIGINKGSFNSFPHLRNLEMYLDEFLFSRHPESGELVLDTLKLTPTESFILLSSILFHDLGRSWHGKFSHACESRIALAKDYRELGIDSEELALCIGRICHFHDPDERKDWHAEVRRKSDNGLEQSIPIQLRDVSITGYGLIREKLLAALLVLVDHLDGSFSRVLPHYIRKDDFGQIGKFRSQIPGIHVDLAARMVVTSVKNNSSDHSKMVKTPDDRDLKKNDNCPERMLLESCHNFFSVQNLALVNEFTKFPKTGVSRFTFVPETIDYYCKIKLPSKRNEFNLLAREHYYMLNAVARRESCFKEILDKIGKYSQKSKLLYDIASDVKASSLQSEIKDLLTEKSKTLISELLVIRESLKIFEPEKVIKENWQRIVIPDCRLDNIPESLLRNAGKNISDFIKKIENKKTIKLRVTSKFVKDLNNLHESLNEQSNIEYAYCCCMCEKAIFDQMYKYALSFRQNLIEDASDNDKMKINELFDSFEKEKDNCGNKWKLHHYCDLFENLCSSLSSIRNDLFEKNINQYFIDSNPLDNTNKLGINWQRKRFVYYKTQRKTLIKKVELDDRLKDWQESNVTGSSDGPFRLIPLRDTNCSWNIKFTKIARQLYFAKDQENVIQEQNEDYLLATIAGNTLENARALRQVGSWLRAYKIPIYAWLISCDEHLYTCFGKETFEPFLSKHFLRQMAESMAEISERMFDSRIKPYERLAADMRENSIERVRLGVRRLAVIMRHPSGYDDGNTIEYLEDGWFWNDEHNPKDKIIRKKLDVLLKYIDKLAEPGDHVDNIFVIKKRD